jgi:DNA invertase Pin-like site-specific DNA recombinase
LNDDERGVKIMTDKRYIVYLRVSTDAQGVRGLGMDAQQAAIDAYLKGGGIVLETYREVESGKKADRPQLSAALEACKRANATLLIAKLDRLSRDLAFIAALMNDKSVDFIALDYPMASRLTLHIMAAVAEHERDMISQRTKAALQAAKARGVKLGNPQNLTSEARAKGRVQGRAVLIERAHEFIKKIGPIIKPYQAQGLSLQGISDRLNGQGIRSAAGGKWTRAKVKRVLDRL